MSIILSLTVRHDYPFVDLVDTRFRSQANRNHLLGEFIQERLNQILMERSAEFWPDLQLETRFASRLTQSQNCMVVVAILFIIYDRKPVQVLLNGAAAVGHHGIDETWFDTELLAKQQAGRYMILLGIETEQPLASLGTYDGVITEKGDPLLG